VNTEEEILHGYVVEAKARIEALEKSVTDLLYRLTHILSHPALAPVPVAEAAPADAAQG
jgi:hypothetical protein